MAIILQLNRMSKAEKLRALEAIWADLANDDFASPSWHAEALREAEARAHAGKAKFSSWPHAKERIRRKTSKGR